MANTYGKVFSTLNSVVPADKLRANILERIDAYEAKRLRVRAAISSLIAITSFVTIFPAWSFLSTGAVRTGFGAYWSLLHSDGSYVLSHFSSFAYTLGTAIPLTETISLLGAAFIFSISAKLTISLLRHSREHEHMLKPASI